MQVTHRETDVSLPGVEFEPMTPCVSASKQAECFLDPTTFAHLLSFNEIFLIESYTFAPT